jgi:DNA-binding CsgD family transcriptional regulator
MGLGRFELDGDEYMVIAVPLAASTDARLTPAEREVVREVVRGLSNEAIGRARGVSKHTVAAHLRAIFKKLGVGSRRELVAAMALGARGKAPTS